MGRQSESGGLKRPWRAPICQGLSVSFGDAAAQQADGERSSDFQGEVTHATEGLLRCTQRGARRSTCVEAVVGPFVVDLLLMPPS